MRADGRELVDSEAVRLAFLALSCPTVLVRAPRGYLDEPRPLLPEEVVAEARAALPHLVDVPVPDTNHWLLCFRDREAAVVAEQIATVAGAGAGG